MNVHATAGSYASPVFHPKTERSIKVTLRPAQCLDRQEWPWEWNCPSCRSSYSMRMINGELTRCGEDEDGYIPGCTVPEDDPRVKDCPNWARVSAGGLCVCVCVCVYVCVRVHVCYLFSLSSLVCVQGKKLPLTSRTHTHTHRQLLRFNVNVGTGTKAHM